MMNTAVPSEHSRETTPRPATTPRLLLTRPAVAMLKKELRELLHWMVGLGVVFAAAIAILFIAKTRQPFDGAFDTSKPDPARMLVSDLFSMLTVIGCPLIALVMGFVQYYKESAPDRYALLTHRPIPRSRLFWLKVAAGLIAYLVAAALPLMITIAWASSTHLNYSPFIWSMALPSLSDCFAGLFYYFAGVLFAMRVWSSWLTTRLLPVGWLLFGTALALYGQPLLHIPHLLLIVIAGLPPIVAARAAFVTSGQVRSQGGIARASLGMLVLTGIYMVSAAALGIASAVAEPAVKWPNHVQVEFLLDGTIVKTVQRYDGAFVHLMDGTLLWPRQQNSERMATSHAMQRLYTRQELAGFHRMPREYRSYFSTGEAMIVSGVRYFAYNNFEQGYIVLFNAQTGKFFGSIGAQGVEIGRQKPHALFAEPVEMITEQSLYMTGNVIYRLTQDLKPEAMFATPDGQRIAHRDFRLGGRVTPGEEVRLTCVATARHVYQLRAKLNTAGEVTLLQLDGQSTNPHPDKVWSLKTLRNRDQEAKWLGTRFDPHRWASNPNKNPPFVLWRNNDGADTYREFANIEYDGPWPSRMSWVDKATECLIPLAVPMFAFSWVTLVEHRSMVTLWHDLTTQPSAIRAVAGGLILGGLSALFVWRTMRKQAFSPRRAALWSAMAFVGGPAIVLLRPAIAQTRVREECPACHKPRPVELTNCPHCNNPWPQPERDGREIFT